jgi:hypothetical protein
MDIAILFDWFTNESMDAALQATELKRRETFLRLAFLWAAAAQQCRKEASATLPGDLSIELIDAAENG